MEKPNLFNRFLNKADTTCDKIINLIILIFIIKIVFIICIAFPPAILIVVFLLIYKYYGRDRIKEWKEMHRSNASIDDEDRK